MTGPDNVAQARFERSFELRPLAQERRRPFPKVVDALERLIVQFVQEIQRQGAVIPTERIVLRGRSVGDVMRLRHQNLDEVFRQRPARRGQSCRVMQRRGKRREIDVQHVPVAPGFQSRPGVPGMH